jgi:YidC/Oxa1 family membrane protein insertase
METKRMILAVALSMAVLVVFQYFTPKRPAPVAVKEGAPAVPVTPGAASVTSGAAAVAAPAVGGVAAGIAPTAAPVTRAVLENDKVFLDLSSRGAAVVGARLKEYKDKAGRGGNPVVLLGAPTGMDVAGETRLAAVGLVPGADFREVERTAGRVTYAWDSPAGVHVEKAYALEPGRYDVALTVKVRNGTAAALKDQLGLLLVRDYSAAEDKYIFTGPTYLRGGDLVQVKLKDLKKGPKQESGQVEWAALLEKYFLVAAVPAAPAGGVRADRHRGQEKVLEVELAGPALDLAPGAESAAIYRLYLGPKLAAALQPLGADLSRVIDYGWFTPIAKPLLAFLKAIYRVTGNYGLAIIVLTTLVKGAFWPLSAKSFQSMQKMKDLQPKMAKLKERYANDRERLNMEVMQLYKTHKVNPLGGCLPMVLQIPVFFALYRVLLSSIELRHAPFLLWITDLSSKDPYYVTPLIMGATMFLQQRLTPATGTDPMQQKMMQYGMPAIFTFMFLNFPSGLVVYWLVNNVLSIVQQAWMIRRSQAAAA